MKKLIGTVAVAAVLATAAFAEISFGSWLRVLGVPVAGNGDEIVSGMVNSWGTGARVARLNIYGTTEDERLGFSMGVYNNTDGFALGDDYVIWAKPWDWLRVSLGKWDYTAFRGDLCFGSWNWVRPYNWLFDDEGLTFDQLGNKCGMQLEIAPVEGLVLMWNLPLGTGAGAWGEAYKMLEGSDAAVKYTIADVGTIKAGWGGQGARKHKNEAWGDGFYGSTTDKNYNTYEDALKAGETLDTIKYFKAGSASGDEYKYYGNVNVAFDLTAVENLFVTVGARISVADSDYRKAALDPAKGSDFGFLKVAVGATYQILDNLGIAANFGVQTYENIDPSFQFGVGVNVGLTDTLTLNADFRGLIPGGYEKGGVKYYDPDPSFSFLVGLQYACSSNGYVGIGFQGTTGGNGFLNASWNDVDKLKADKSDSFCWAVPIAVSLWL